MSKKNIWVIKGFGEENPEKIMLKGNETVGEFREKYAKELGVNSNNIELSTDTTRLTNDDENLSKVLDDGETINVLPRAKAGKI